jgi:hypothetical protein
MTTFNCTVCLFSSKHIGDYKRHIKSHKHISLLKKKIEDSKGIIYLIQPCELIGTGRYKIGCSKNSTLDRVKNGYKKGTRYLYIAECINPLIIETRIKQEFNKNFKLIAGREYYEGNENDIKNTFINIVNNNKNINNFNNINLPDNINNNLNTKNIILYNCKYCNYSTSRQHDYKTHLISKTHIKVQQTYNMTNIFPIIQNYPQNENNDTIKSSFYCKYCNKNISYKNKKRHYMTTCLEIPNEMKNKLIKQHNDNQKTKNKLNYV